MNPTMIIKHENNIPIEGTQIHFPDKWNDVERGITRLNPTMEIMAEYGYMEYIQPEQPSESLQSKQARIWEQIKAERDRRCDNGVNVAGKWFHTDTKSRSQHLGMVIAGASLPAINWKTMDGSFITVTPALALSIFNADFTLDITNFAVAETHKIAMLALDNPEGYDFSASWMPTYTPVILP